jgi:hypothetical protein
VEREWTPEWRTMARRPDSDGAAAAERRGGHVEGSGGGGEAGEGGAEDHQAALPGHCAGCAMPRVRPYCHENIESRVSWATPYKRSPQSITVGIPIEIPARAPFRVGTRLYDHRNQPGMPHLRSSGQCNSRPGRPRRDRRHSSGWRSSRPGTPHPDVLRRGRMLMGTGPEIACLKKPGNLWEAAPMSILSFHLRRFISRSTNRSTRLNPDALLRGRGLMEEVPETARPGRPGGLREAALLSSPPFHPHNRTGARVAGATAGPVGAAGTRQQQRPGRRTTTGPRARVGSGDRAGPHPYHWAAGVTPGVIKRQRDLAGPVEERRDG